MKVQTPARLNQPWNLPVSLHLHLGHLRSCAASLVFGFCVMSLPLYQRDRLETAALVKENYTHVTECCVLLRDFSALIFSFYVTPALSHQRKRMSVQRACSMGLRYAASTHVSFPRGGTLTDTSCVRTTKHIHICV